MASPIIKDDIGATVVITHRVHKGKQEEYENWLDEIAPFCRASTGFLDWHIVRPIMDVTETYTVIIRFNTIEHLKIWISSNERKRLIAQVQSLLVEGDDFFISSGLDFWFIPQGAKAKIPVRWKQFLITWSAIYPLALGLSYVISPALQQLGIPEFRPFSALIATGITVFLMVYVVMPRYTRLVQRWLFA